MTTPPFYEVECTCGENVLIACDADGLVWDGSSVSCPGCGATLAVNCDSETPVWWSAHYEDCDDYDTLCFHYYEDDVPDGCELLKAG